MQSKMKMKMHNNRNKRVCTLGSAGPACMRAVAYLPSGHGVCRRVADDGVGQKRWVATLVSPGVQGGSVGRPRENACFGCQSSSTVAW